MSTSNNNNNDRRTANFSNNAAKVTRNTTAIRTTTVGIIIALILAVAGITTTSSSIPTAAAQPYSGERGQTTFFAEDDNNEGRRLSILGALGISLVEGVKVTGIVLNDEDTNKVTVTVARTHDNTGTTPSVTVAAFKTQLDLISLLEKHHMMMEKGQMEIAPHMGTNEEATPYGTMAMTTPESDSMTHEKGMHDIKSFIESLEIGSNIEKKGWNSPAEITVPVIDDGSANDTVINGTSSAAVSDTDIVLVLVIPFTGENGNNDNNTTTGSTTGSDRGEDNKLPAMPSHNKEGRNY